MPANVFHPFSHVKQPIFLGVGYVQRRGFLARFGIGQMQIKAFAVVLNYHAETIRDRLDAQPYLGGCGVFDGVVERFFEN